MNILYVLHGTVYLNITNTCPCACVFCIRGNMEGVGSADNLWLEREPSYEEIIAAINAHDFSGYAGEIVFYGFGEPTCALANLLGAARYIKETLGLPLRLNTNGLSDLINARPTAGDICRSIDTVSISLNAPQRDAYQAVTRSSFGPESFEAMLAFARDVRACGKQAVFTVVDTLPAQQIEESRELAQSLGIPLRVRAYEG